MALHVAILAEPQTAGPVILSSALGYISNSFRVDIVPFNKISSLSGDLNFSFSLYFQVGLMKFYSTSVFKV